jgi:hypothetical protein
VLESLGDSPSGSVASASSLAVESPGDPTSDVGSSDPFPEPSFEPSFEPPLRRESPGDSEARGDPEGVDGEPEGLA